MELKTYWGEVIFSLEAAKTVAELVTAALSAKKSLRDACLRHADLSGAVLGDKKVHAMRVFSGLYRDEVWAVGFQDGERWVRMGWLWKSLDEWERIGIRKSNLSEYPDDGSEKCEERVAAFEFAKAATLRMKLPDPPKE